MFKNRTIDQIHDNKFGIVDTTVREKANVIVYHIFCGGNYKEVVSSQITRLKESGLYDWCDLMEVTCVDVEEKYEGIDEIFEGMDKVNITKINRNAFEYWSIKKIWDLSQKYDGKVFYFHSKGVTNTYTNLVTRENNDWKSYGVSYWREMLEYFLINNFTECVNNLDEYDNCGVTCNDGWYWGNFWWSNFYFVRKNEEPHHGDRWYYEAWLNKGRIAKNHEFIRLNFNLYFSKLPVEFYRDPEAFKNRKITIQSAYYGTLGIQQDEGYPAEIPLVNEDVTDKVREYFNDNKLEIAVDNALFGDPIYGYRKHLVVNILIDDEPFRLVYNEGVRAKL
jgi:hypothetical protein